MKPLKAAFLTLTLAGLAACLGCAAEPAGAPPEKAPATTEAPTSASETPAAGAPTKTPKESGSTAAKKKDPFAADKGSKDPFSDF